MSGKCFIFTSDFPTLSPECKALPASWQVECLIQDLSKGRRSEMKLKKKKPEKQKAKKQKKNQNKAEAFSSSLRSRQRARKGDCHPEQVLACLTAPSKRFVYISKPRLILVYKTGFGLAFLPESGPFCKVSGKHSNDKRCLPERRKGNVTFC